MSSSLTPISKNLLSWGYTKVTQCAEYAWNSAKAVYHIAQSTLGNYRTGMSLTTAGSEAIKTCPEFKSSRNFEETVRDASQGNVEPVNSEVYLDVQHLSFGAPQTKRIHTVNDPKLIEDVLHAKRDDVLVASGFKEDLDPLIKKEGDTMLLCPYARHRTLRSPLEKTFSKRSAQDPVNIAQMASTVVELLFVQVCDYDEFVIEAFVFSTIVKQVLSLELASKDERAILSAMRDAQSENQNTRIQARQELESIIVSVLREHHYKAGGGMEAIAKAQLLTEAEKISTTILMFAAGMHTTINFLKCFTEVLRLSGYNEKINEEWKEFTKGNANISNDPLAFAVTVADFVKQSDLLNSCYLETMRLYPVIPIIKRVAKKHFMLGNTRVYPGDEIHLNVMAAQRDARHWEDPTQFKPERFAGSLENGKKPHLLNFGLGSQGCIGKHFAESESKVMGALFCIFLKSNWKNSVNLPANADNYQYDSFALSIINRNEINQENFNLRDNLLGLQKSES